LSSDSCNITADFGVLLGSGLGEVTDGFDVDDTVPFAALPGITQTGVEGHRGLVKCARVGTRHCVFVEGRRHVYEGDTAPLRALTDFIAGTGVREFLVTSACGSLEPRLPPGRLVLAGDLLDLQNRRPRHEGTTPAPRRFAVGPRLDLSLGDELRGVARDAGIPLERGVIACNAGPAYETAAEVRALRGLGASVVTMSGAPEIGHFAEVGIRVASIAIVTNWATGISASTLAHSEVLAVAGEAVRSLQALIRGYCGITIS
jgi:inosine/guanosine/xanthosine phosphorylase family protein